jgi:hypothetical protein
MNYFSMLLLAIFIILISGIVVLFITAHIKAKKVFGNGTCSNQGCNKPQEYLPLDGSTFGRGYLCSNCGSFVYFPIDFSKPKATLLTPFDRDEEIEDDEKIDPLIEKF